VSARTDSKETNIQSGPNWAGFARYLAIGRMRRLGILPMPKEVAERLEREKVEAAKQKSAV